MDFSISNLFGLVFELVMAAALFPVINIAINYAMPHVGSFSQLLLKLFIPVILAMIISSAAEEEELPPAGR